VFESTVSGTVFESTVSGTVFESTVSGTVFLEYGEEERRSAHEERRSAQEVLAMLFVDERASLRRASERSERASRR
jgi:hypothetical protein